jgi:hypothetical protein
MSASDCSSSVWPTVAASEPRQGFQRRREGMASEQNQQSLTTVAMLWPTPSAVFLTADDPDLFRARAARLKEKHGNKTGNGAGPTLATVANVWPTPIANDHKSIYASEETHAKTDHARPLREVVGLWSTPRASDSEKGGPNQSFCSGAGLPLTSQAHRWSTPRAHEAVQYTRDRGDPTKSRPSLTGQAFSHQGPATSMHGEPSSSERRNLNPQFVEWLMGWPNGWTASACSVTAFSRWRQLMRCALSQLGLPAEAPPAQLALFG